jgi:FxsC-like protein
MRCVDFGSASGSTGLVFFLSYARLDGENNPYFEQFKKELYGELIANGIPNPRERCFLDGDTIQLGDNWSDAIENALRSCNSFVALLSPNYIQRPACGLEWRAFTSRLSSEQPPELLPIQWNIFDGTIPEEIGRHQFKHSALGQLYSEKGLRHLFRLDEVREYKTAVSALAKRIADAEKRSVTHAGPLPATMKLGSAFAASRAPGAQTTNGPKWVDFVIVAGRADELRKTVRTDVRFYGNDPDDWAPYSPESQRIAVELQALASQEMKTASFTPVTPHLIANIKEAARNNRIIIIVIDVWTLELESYADIMRQYDELAKVHCAAVVLWNRGDPELDEKRAVLVDRLRAVFEYKSRMQDQVEFRWDIESLDDFRAHLRHSIVRIQNKIFKNPAADAPPPARAVGVGLGSPPRVSGPGQ